MQIPNGKQYVQFMCCLQLVRMGNAALFTAALSDGDYRLSRHNSKIHSYKENLSSSTILGDTLKRKTVM